MLQEVVVTGQKSQLSVNTERRIFNVSSNIAATGASADELLAAVPSVDVNSEGEISLRGNADVLVWINGKKMGMNDDKLDPQFSVDYLFDFFGKLHNMKDDDIRTRKSELFNYFGIEEFKTKKIEELSTGMKQKAAIAVSLAHDPDIIIFDEPTSGLDIITARLVTDYLKKLRDEGKLIIISTHIMSEAEALCDRIAIIIDGKKICENTIPEILKEYNVTNLEDAFFKMYKLNHKEDK